MIYELFGTVICLIVIGVFIHKHNQKWKRRRENEQEQEKELLREQERHLYIRQYGRFGNSLIQVRNAIKVGLQKGCAEISIQGYAKKITLPESNVENKASDQFNFITILNRSGENYFYAEKLHEIVPDVNLNQNDPEINLILDNYLIERYQFIYSQYLCIHIRSGDLFKKTKPNRSYIQPPYDFYEIILNSLQYKDKPVVLVAEDTNNPVINKLLDNYPNIIFEKRSLKKDQEIILNAQQIVFGFGTFVPQLIKISKGNKKSIWFHKDKIVFQTHSDGLAMTKKEIPVNNYINIWKNAPEQLDIMLDYQLKDNCPITELKNTLNDF